MSAALPGRKEPEPALGRRSDWFMESAALGNLIFPVQPISPRVPTVARRCHCRSRLLLPRRLLLLGGLLQQAPPRPQAHQAVSAGAGERLPVGRERQSVDPTDVPA